MKAIIYPIVLLLSIPASYVYAADNNTINTTKQERNYITQGNKLYREKRFAEAEVMYKKALELVPSSETANYNLASALIRQSGTTDINADNNPLAEAKNILTQLSQNGQDKTIVERAYYNLGNMAFNTEDYKQAIEMYKNALRRNPDNDKTRQNLRLAQIKLQEQQDNQDNQNNQDQNKDQDKQQDQQQNKNDNQNQDQQDNQNQDNQQQNQDKDKEQQKPEQQRGGISDSNAEKILKAMENEEAATRRRVEAQKKKEGSASQRQIINPW